MPAFRLESVSGCQGLLSLRLRIQAATTTITGRPAALIRLTPARYTSAAPGITARITIATGAGPRMCGGTAVGAATAAAGVAGAAVGMVAGMVAGTADRR